jgi:pantoate--beta-alanine ligase
MSERASAPGAASPAVPVVPVVPVVIDSARALRQRCDAYRQAGKTVGFVPTLGALHAGHMSLLAAARARGADVLVVSIFVNPLQFGPNEDFAKYPRTFEGDLALCREHGVELVYAPDRERMYPAGFSTHVEVTGLTERFEGALRPTHFRGVTTVVAKLLHAVGPAVVCFGSKDYQQWCVIDRMARDLDLPVEIVRCPTAREPDGLALSSRNRYLTPDQRARAVAISAGLRAADAAYRAGERTTATLEALARTPIAASFDSIDYVSLADAETLAPFGEHAERKAVLLIAARLGATRLLDNAVLGHDAL